MNEVLSGRLTVRAIYGVAGDDLDDCDPAVFGNSIFGRSIFGGRECGGLLRDYSGGASFQRSVDNNFGAFSQHAPSPSFADLDGSQYRTLFDPDASAPRPLFSFFKLQISDAIEKRWIDRFYGMVRRVSLERGRLRIQTNDPVYSLRQSRLNFQWVSVGQLIKKARSPDRKKDNDAYVLESEDPTPFTDGDRSVDPIFRQCKIDDGKFHPDSIDVYPFQTEENVLGISRAIRQGTKTYFTFNQDVDFSLPAEILYRTPIEFPVGNPVELLRMILSDKEVDGSFRYVTDGVEDWNEDVYRKSRSICDYTPVRIRLFSGDDGAVYDLCNTLAQITNASFGWDSEGLFVFDALRPHPRAGVAGKLHVSPETATDFAFEDGVDDLHTSFRVDYAWNEDRTYGPRNMRRMIYEFDEVVPKLIPENLLEKEGHLLLEKRRLDLNFPYVQLNSVARTSVMRRAREEIARRRQLRFKMHALDQDAHKIEVGDYIDVDNAEYPPGYEDGLRQHLEARTTAMRIRGRSFSVDRGDVALDASPYPIQFHGIHDYGRSPGVIRVCGVYDAIVPSEIDAICFFGNTVGKEIAYWRRDPVTMETFLGVIRLDGVRAGRNLGERVGPTPSEDEIVDPGDPPVVAPVIHSISLFPKSVRLEVGQSVKLEARAFQQLDSRLVVIPGVVFAWNSSNAGIATIEQTGNEGEGEVSGISEGIATITVSARGKKQTATITVVDIPVDNRDPVFPTETADRSITENTGAATTASAQDIGSAFVAVDPDNDPVSYSLGGTHADMFEIGNTTGQLTTKVGVNYNHESNPTLTITVWASDGKGGSDRVSVTVSVDDALEPPLAPSAPSVSTLGTQSLSVSWASPFNTGRPAITSYDLRYSAGTSGAWSNGPQGVTGTSSTITGLSENTEYQVQVRATNAEGNSPWSASGSGTTGTPPQGNHDPSFSTSTTTRTITENIGASNEIAVRTLGSPITAVDPDGDDIEYSLGGTHAGMFDINSDTGQLSSKVGVLYDHEANSTLSVTITARDDEGGSDSITVKINVSDRTEPPLAPTAPSVSSVPDSYSKLAVSWASPFNTGRPAITSYDLRYSAGTSGAWSNGPQGVTGTSSTITGLSENTEYQVQVRATNAEGNSPWSASGSGTTNESPIADCESPTLTINGPSQIYTGENGTYTVVLMDGTYDSSNAVFTASNGSITYSGRTGILTAPSSPGSALIKVVVVVRGRGIDAQNGCRSTRSITKTVTFIDRPPPVAPVTSLSISHMSAPLDDCDGCDIRLVKLIYATDTRTANARVKFSWNKVGSLSVSSITVDQSVLVGTNASGTHTVSDLDPGEDYDFDVEYPAGGATPDTISKQSTAPLGVPCIPVASFRINGNSVVISWTPGGDGGSEITGYEAWYRSRTGSAHISQVRSVGGSARSISFSTLNYDTWYDVFIRAVNGLGRSCNVKLDVRIPVRAVNCDGLSNPSGFSTIRTCSAIQLSFTAPSSPPQTITGYRLDYIRLDADTTVVSMQSITVNTTATQTSITAILTGLDVNKAYRIIVYTITQDCISSGTNRQYSTRPISQPSPVTGLTASAASGTTDAINLSWNPNDECATNGFRYHIRYRQTNLASSWTDRPGTVDSTSIRQTGLDQDTEYDFQVRADNKGASNNLSAWSDTVTAKTNRVAAPPITVPGKVSTPNVQSFSTNTADEPNRILKLILTWSKPSNGGAAIEGYDIQRKLSSNNVWIDQNHTGTVTTSTFNFLNQGESHDFRVRATNSEGEGLWSESATGTTGQVVTTQPPLAPRGVVQTSITHNSISIAWRAPMTEEGRPAVTAYRLRIQTSGTNASDTTLEVSSTTFIHTFSNLLSFQTYQISVAGISSAPRDKLNWASVNPNPRTLTAPIAPVPAISGSPTLTTPNRGEIAVDLPTIRSPGDSLTGRFVSYRVDTTGSPWTEVNVGATTENYTITGLLDSTTYRVRVKASNGAGTSSWSSESTTTTDDAPPPVTMNDPPEGVSASMGASTATLSWSAPSAPGVTPNGYEVRYKKNTETTWNTTTGLSSTTKSYGFTGLDTGTPYQFAVRARYTQNDGASSWISTTGTTTAPSVPGTVSSPTVQNVTWSGGKPAIRICTTPPTDIGGGALTNWRSRIYILDLVTANYTLQSIQQTTSTRNYRVVTGLKPGEEYQVEVAWANSIGRADFSSRTTIEASRTVDAAGILDSVGGC